MRQTVMALNPTNADFIPMSEFFNTKFVDVEGDAMGFLFDPPKGWANVKDCGNFPCTAP